MRLKVPDDLENEASCELNDEELDYVGEQLDKVNERNIRSTVVSRGDFAEKDPRVEELRKKMHDEYDGVVLRDEFLPNPPVRGDYGHAFIPLKEGAESQRSKPFTIFGKK